MKLETLDRWVERHFHEGSRPARSTVWRWIREGKLPATKIGRRYYINPETKPLQ